MPETTNIVPDVIEALRAAIASSVTGTTIASFVSSYDYRLADEERDGILGQWIPAPHVIVAPEMGDSTHAILRVRVSVKHDQEVSTLATHKEDARAVFDMLYAMGSLSVEIIDDVTLTFGILPQSFSVVGWERAGRAYQSTLSFSLAVNGP